MSRTMLDPGETKTKLILVLPFTGSYLAIEQQVMKQ